MSVQVWSSGGGVQSSAIAALIVSGRLPRPDHAIIVDTEREKSQTWRYMSTVIQPALRSVDCELVIIPKSEYATVDLWGSNGDLLLPAFTSTDGRLKGFCSNEWKQRVVRRWLRSKGINDARMWLGFSLDEQRRMRCPDVDWLTYWFPLAELRMTRDQCWRVVVDLGWPEPPRSSCWMCPHMSNAEWRQLRDSDPDDFQKAIRLDALIREDDADAFIHRSGRPLAVADLGTDDARLPFGCDSGSCFV
jgi:hypothetical protein